MRDPMSWAVPLPRMFGIPVKVHVFFFVITLGLFFRQVLQKDNPIWWVDVLMVSVVLLFFIVLLHEFGHCFGGRAVGGEAKEILIWPLGGLAFVEVPHTARANMITVAAGPFVNLVLCIACAAGLIAGGFWPALNPLNMANPFVNETHSFRDGKDYTSEYGLKLYKPGPNPGEFEQVLTPFEIIEKNLKDYGISQRRYAFSPEFSAQMANAYAPMGVERALAPAWVVWLQRIFLINWCLLLFNLIPAYPLDGGQLLQCFVWARSDYRKGVTWAAYSGFGVSILFLIVSITANEALFMGLALFMLYMSSMKLHSLEQEEGPFGYDFSGGYTTLEKDDEPAPKPKRPGFFTRWRQARRAKKMLRDLEQRQADEARMDHLLEKIAQQGKASLTEDEKRFLEQFSSKYRNK